MKAAKLGLFFSTGTRQTEKVALQVKEQLGEHITWPQPINAAVPSELSKYDGLVLGVPSYLWDRYRVSALDWDTVVPPFSNPRDLEGKKVAFFGCGDQLGYPENFVDGMGIVWEMMQLRGADLVGKTSTEGYEFTRSKAARGGEFCGLAIDQDNQSDLTEARIKAWCQQLRRELELD